MHCSRNISRCEDDANALRQLNQRANVVTFFPVTFPVTNIDFMPGRISYLCSFALICVHLRSLVTHLCPFALH